MPQTIEVRFKGTRREFFLWPDDQEPLRRQEAVIVDADRGQDLGRVHTTGETAEKKCGSCSSCAVGDQLAHDRAGGRPVQESAPEDQLEGATAAADPEMTEPPGSQIAEAPGGPTADAPSSNPSGLRTILRRASQQDIRQSNELRLAEEEARRQVLAKVRHHRLEMKVSDAEWQWDRAKLTVYFTADKRVDFRALVRDLAGVFRTRIELRQIGVRDEAARLNGVGRCGREYCCSTWLTELSPVSLALAKDQHLSLNPAQISGGCGRLLCCLKYEHEFYVTARKRFPREGKQLRTAAGMEKVVAVDIFRERVFLRSEQQGARIIPLVQLKEEMDIAAAQPAGALAAPAESLAALPTPERPRRRERPRPDSPRVEPGPGQGPERRSRAPNQRPQDPPESAGSQPPGPAPAEPPSSEAVPPGDRASDPSPRRRSRRRRGRRGKPPQGPSSPPEA